MSSYHLSRPPEYRADHVVVVGKNPVGPAGTPNAPVGPGIASALKIPVYPGVVPVLIALTPAELNTVFVKLAPL